MPCRPRDFLHGKILRRPAAFPSPPQGQDFCIPAAPHERQFIAAIPSLTRPISAFSIQRGTLVTPPRQVNESNVSTTAKTTVEFVRNSIQISFAQDTKPESTSSTVRPLRYLSDSSSRRQHQPLDRLNPGGRFVVLIRTRSAGHNFTHFLEWFLNLPPTPRRCSPSRRRSVKDDAWSRRTHRTNIFLEATSLNDHQPEIRKATSGRTSGLHRASTLFHPFHPVCSSVSRHDWSCMATGGLFMDFVKIRIPWPLLTLFVSLFAAVRKAAPRLWHNLVRGPLLMVCG